MATRTEQTHRQVHACSCPSPRPGRLKGSGRNGQEGTGGQTAAGISIHPPWYCVERQPSTEVGPWRGKLQTVHRQCGCMTAGGRAQATARLQPIPWDSTRWSGQKYPAVSLHAPPPKSGLGQDEAGAERWELKPGVPSGWQGPRSPEPSRLPLAGKWSELDLGVGSMEHWET